MALGASRGAILRTVLAQYAWPMVAGAVAGLATATWLVRFGKSQWEVFASLEAVDPAGLGMGLAVFALIAAVAAMWPARTALGIDPSSALRHE
jgi:ABC-type lipoprotein release transport system permease subunit